MKPVLRGLVAAVLGAGCVTLARPGAAQPFSTPVGCDNCISAWYYVDHGNRTDYDCSSSTYDGHNGSDYSLRGGNSRIDDGNEVLAAAAGIVRTVSDGNFDRCTACGGSGCGTDTPGGGFSNYVVIDHGDYDTTYGHMRSGSIPVQEGDSVECGTVIGHIGSAGCSTGAHLHFQPRLAGANYRDLLDPYEGSCSPTESSLWVEQGPHRGLPGYTCEDLPPMPTCPAETYEIWTCTQDGTSRRRCIDGVDSTETCTYGCSQMPGGTDDVCALPPDEDGDGVRADTDCDDTRADVHPGAIDSCGDGLDQDCSGTDETCDTASTAASVSTSGGTEGAAAVGDVGSVSTTDSTASAGSGGITGATAGAGGSTAGGPVTTMTASSTASNGTTTGLPGTSTMTSAGVGGSASSGAAQPMESGCACRVEGSRPGGVHRILSLLGLVGVALGRRRNPRKKELTLRSAGR